MKRNLLALAIASSLLAACSSDEPENVAPTVNVNPVSADEQTSVTLIADALDSDGAIAGFAWTQTSGTTVALDATDKGTISFIAPNITTNETLTFSVTVTDDDGATTTATGDVDVIANLPPTVTANDVSADEKSTVQLMADAQDSDGTVTTYEWTQLSGPDLSLGEATGNPLTFTAPDIDENQTYTLSVTATDNDGDSAQTDFTLTLIANLPPQVLVVGAQAMEREENVTLSATATDADGAIASYAWRQTAGENVTLSGENTPVLSFTAPALRDDTTLTFDVTVTDNDGDSTTVPVNAMISEITRDFALSGLVTDEPIPDAVLFAAVNDTVVETQATADGRYSVSIATDDEDDDRYLVLDAQGVGEQDFVQFRSYVDTAGDLYALGETLDESDTLRLNVTNLTTALAALMERANGGDIATRAEFDNALSNMQVEQLLPYATALKLLVDGTAQGETFALPPGANNTYELALNAGLMDSVVNDMQANHAQAYLDAQAAMMADPAIIDNQTDAQALTNTYHFLGGDYNGGAGQLQLHSNGEAHYYTNTRSVAGTWTAEDGQAVIRDVVDEGDDFGEIITSFSFRNLLNTANNGLAYLSLNTQQSMDPNSPDGETLTISTPYVLDTGLLPLTPLVGDFMVSAPIASIRNDEEGYGFNGTSMALSVDADGQYRYEKTIGTDIEGTPIKVSGQGLSQRTADGMQIRFQVEGQDMTMGLARDLLKGHYLNIYSGKGSFETQDSQGVTRGTDDVAGSGFVFPRHTTPLTAETLAPFYELISNNDLQRAFYTFDNEMQAQRITWSDDNQNGIAEDAELFSTTLFYQVSDGVIMLREYRKTRDFGGDSHCDGQVGFEHADKSDGCVIYREFEWDVLSVSQSDSGAQQLNMNEHSSFIDFSQWFSAEQDEARRVSFVNESLFRVVSIDALPFDTIQAQQSVSDQHMVDAIQAQGFVAPTQLTK